MVQDFFQLKGFSEILGYVINGLVLGIIGFIYRKFKVLNDIPVILNDVEIMKKKQAEMEKTQIKIMHKQNNHAQQFEVLESIKSNLSDTNKLLREDREARIRLEEQMKTVFTTLNKMN